MMGFYLSSAGELEREGVRRPPLEGFSSIQRKMEVLARKRKKGFTLFYRIETFGLFGLFPECCRGWGRW